MHILFVTATRIGDAVLSTGLLSYLIERHPTARLTIAAGPVAAPLFEAVPRLERLEVIEKRRWSAHWLPFYAAVATRRWDLVVDLRGSALAWLLRAGERRVMAKGDAREHRVRQLARLFRPRPAAEPAPVDGAASRARRGRADPAGRSGPGDRTGRELARQAVASRALRRAGAAADRCGRPAAGARVAVLAAAHERRQAEPLLAAIPLDRRIDLVGKVDLLTAAAVLRRCALFIGNDTGLMHIAAASGTPTLGLFGPSPSDQYAPWGQRTALVRSSDPPETMFGPGFDHRTTDTLMDGLSVDAAEAAARQLWRSVASAAA